MTRHKLFRIMLDEDGEISAELAQCWLKNGLGTGFILHPAKTLSSALKFLHQKVVDLTILDLNLPDSLGLETFRSVYVQN